MSVIQENYVGVWLEGNTARVRTINDSLVAPYGIFVTSNGDVYVDNGASHSRVELWTPSATSGALVLNLPTTSSCYGLFVDSENSLYCSLFGLHGVIKQPNRSNINTFTIVAGNATAGLSSTLLNNPGGIFVDLQLQLYVADCGNNRVQRFRLR